MMDDLSMKVITGGVVGVKAFPVDDLNRDGVLHRLTVAGPKDEPGGSRGTVYLYSEEAGQVCTALLATTEPDDGYYREVVVLPRSVWEYIREFWADDQSIADTITEMLTGMVDADRETTEQ